MVDRREVPADVVATVRRACTRLPESVEEIAWVGTRWRIRTATFAHLVLIDGGWPPMYAHTFGDDGPVTVLTFQSAGEELDAFGRIGHPFVRPPWRPGIVGMVLDHSTDWDEVAELVTDSYCLLAPQRLAALVERPPSPDR